MQPNVEVHIWDFDLGGGGLEAYYLDHSEGHRAMAIDPGVEPKRRRLWELVAHGMERVPARVRHELGRRIPLARGYLFYAPGAHSRPANALAVRAVSAVIGELEPEWVLDVLDARRVADDPRVVAAWCGLPIEVVLAVGGL